MPRVAPWDASVLQTSLCALFGAHRKCSEAAARGSGARRTWQAQQLGPSPCKLCRRRRLPTRPRSPIRRWGPDPGGRAHIHGTFSSRRWITAGCGGNWRKPCWIRSATTGRAAPESRPPRSAAPAECARGRRELPEPRPARPAPPPPGPARRTPCTRARACPRRLHLLRGAPRPLNWLRELAAPPAPRGTLETVVRPVAGPWARCASRNPKPPGFSWCLSQPSSGPSWCISAQNAPAEAWLATFLRETPAPLTPGLTRVLGALCPKVHAVPGGLRHAAYAGLVLPLSRAESGAPRLRAPQSGLSPPPPATGGQDSGQETESL